MRTNYIRRAPHKSLHAAILRTLCAKFHVQIDDKVSDEVRQNYSEWFARTVDFNIGMFNGGTFFALATNIAEAANNQRLLREGHDVDPKPMPKVNRRTSLYLNIEEFSH